MKQGQSLLEGLSLAVAAFFLAFAAPAHADERILRYSSDIQVRKDSTVEVTETIDVNAEHVRIIHGIYRDFPTRYRGPHGTQFHVGFTLLGATLDGSPVRASVEPSGNGVRIKLGDADSEVAQGEHEYVIRYRATREIGRFGDFDELYWNVTGTKWVVPIDVAEVRIRLPEPARFGQRAVYTGPEGSTASNAEVVEERPGEISFRTTLPLGPYEGLTIAAAFPKGVVAEPSSRSRSLGLLGRLFAVAEAYPELKANTNFLQLQDQLSSIETELQGARRYYNATVRDLNSTVQSFPPVLIAGPLGFKEVPFYQDEDPAIQTAPKVSFARPAA
jgi:hypothetical protein